MAAAEEDDTHADGRRQRGQENRRRIVEAMFLLIREGTISPSAEEVSARAKVGLRTVFRHFDDMDSLYREISELMLAEIGPAATACLPQGNWPDVLEAMIDWRATVFEKIMPLKIAADVHKHRSAFLREDDRTFIEAQRTMLRAAAPPALRKDRLRLEALELILSYDSWRRLRQDQHLTVAQAKGTIRLAADALGIDGAA